jgi:replicative DNA helicase Mcm
MGVWDFLKQNRPLFGRNHSALAGLKPCLDKQALRKVKQKLNLGEVSFIQASLGITKRIAADSHFSILSPKTPGKEIRRFVEEINERIEASVLQKHYKAFSGRAFSAISGYVAHKLHGMKTIREAITLQMFSKENVHVLLLGDPGTGKTVFLQSVEKLHPVTAFGLGSGTSSVGLGMTIKGKTVKPGLLPQANGGICLIDELNLMKKEDYASLYSAMEKGFITYDKGGTHQKFEANVRLLATANPIGDKFRGTTRDAIIRQLPFEPALLSRFTLVFLLRKPDLKTFMSIAGDIVDKAKTQIAQGDVDFIRKYIEFALKIEVDFPKRFKELVVEFSKQIMQAEDRLFFEVSPRLIHGLINLSKAYARMRLANQVTEEDVMRAKTLVWGSLENKVG